MKKLFKDFKAFITKGNVMDLAVGMIIGSAFTAIVTALVNGILKPLINWIPISDAGTGLQTVLRPATLDAEGNVLTAALVLDWGAVISAIITFLLTAVVLFAIVKIFAKAKDLANTAKEKAEAVVEKLEKKDGEAETAEVVPEAPVEESAPVVEEAPAPEVAVENLSEETPASILAEIRDLLKAQALNNKTEE